MITLKNSVELLIMRETGRIVAQVMEELNRVVTPGVNTIWLDKLAEDMCYSLGAVPAFKGYRGYKYSLCCSVNDQVVHGFPNVDSLQQGDILSIDFGCFLDGFYGDAAITVVVGGTDDDEVKALMETTEASLMAGIAQMQPGNRLGDISAAVQKTVETAGFSVVRQFVGHGIGRSLHEEPQVPNYGNKGHGLKLNSGLVLAIEPMVNVGSWEVKIIENGWTAVTVDGKLSAHFEHMVAVTEDGPTILTLP